MGTYLAIGINFALQPRPIERGITTPAAAAFSSRQHTHSSLKVEAIRQGPILGQPNPNHNAFSHSQHNRDCGPGET